VVRPFTILGTHRSLTPSISALQKVLLTAGALQSGQTYQASPIDLQDGGDLSPIKLATKQPSLSRIKFKSTTSVLSSASANPGRVSRVARFPRLA
jgi:hypothetical protein